MRSANLKVSHPQIDASDLAMQIRDAVDHSADPQLIPESFQPPQNNDYRPASLAFSDSFEVNRDDRYAAAELLKFNDAEFIDAVYRAILKREPDDAGARFYLQSLRDGSFDKLHVILALLSSEEGKQKNVRIEGLNAPLRLRRLTRLPVVGSWLRYAVDLLRAPILMRRLDQLTVIADTRNQQIAHHVNQTNRDIGDALSDGLAALNARVSDVSQAANQQHAQTEQRFTTVQNELANSIGESAAATKTELRAETQSEITREAKATRTEFQQQLESLNTTVAVNAREAESRVDELRGEIERTAGEINEVRGETGRVSNQTQRLRQEVVVQRARLALLEELLKRAPAASDQRTETVDAPSGNLDALYAELEDNFRGNRDTLKQSFRFYLPYVQSLPQTELDVIDLGCGRGEWLEVLSENKIKAIGIDDNRVMIESCAERSLSVMESDGLAYLRAQPADSLRAVTAFHLIEHLPTEKLVALLDEIMRTLQPGGAAIFETPNPDNLFVASNYFYHDPTHRNPLPSRLTKFLVESRGFARVEIINLHECAEGRFTGSDEVSVRLNELFYGPMDYAIVGWKHD